MINNVMNPFNIVPPTSKVLGSSYEAAGTDQASQTASFSDFLKGAIDNVAALQNDAKVSEEKLATGEIDDIQSTMIAMEKADLSLQYALAVRNKVLDAYNEIMRMQI